MERGLTMLLHSIIIGVFMYIFMIYVLKQKQPVAEHRTLLLSALILAYMLLFGHGLPTSIHRHIL